MSPGIVLLHTPHYYILVNAPCSLFLLYDCSGGRLARGLTQELLQCVECLPARLFPSAPLPVQTWIHCTGHCLHREGQTDKLRHTDRSFDRIGYRFVVID